jgi:hypothetical protein
MAKFGSTVLVAGMLAASANAAFADNRQHHPQPKVQQNYAAPLPAGDEFPASSAFTKDGKSLQVQISIPSKDVGMYKPDQFRRALSGGVMMAAIKTFSQFTEAEIPKNMDKIQKMITAEVGATVPMGTVGADGKPGMAKAGVNYGNATVVSVKEAIGGKVIFEQKAPATQPATKPATPKA